MTVRRPNPVVDRYSPDILTLVTLGAIYPLHRQTGHELLYLENGSGLLYVDGSVRTLTPGDLVFIERDTTHGFVFSPDARCLLAGIQGGLTPQFTDFITQLCLPFFIVPRATDDPQTARTIRYMLTHPSDMKTGVKLMSELGTLLDRITSRLELSHRLPRKGKLTLTDRLAQAEYREIDQQKPSLEHLAHALELSPTYVSRSMKPLTGLSFPDYMALTRIDGARRLLVQSDKKIGDIARMCGYTSIRTFNRHFLHIVGCTGSEYRQRCGQTQIVTFDSPALRPVLTAFYEQLADNGPLPTD